MKYNTIKIFPSKDDWEISYEESDVERVEGSGSLSDFGYYHYPRHIDKMEAFSKLKESMIRRHEDEITKLQISLNKLKELKW